MPAPLTLPFKPSDGYSLTTESKKLLPVNPERKFLSLQNLGSVNAWVQFGRDAKPNECTRIAAGGYVAFDVIVPGNDLYARSETGTALLIIGEA